GKDGMEVPDLGEFAAKDWPSPEKGFAAMMQAIDRSVGTLLAKLTDLGIGDDTLVIFSSDNGPHQEGGHQMTFFDSNGPLQGKKRDLYEGGIRVPMIARWPGIIAAGSESAHISAFQDVFPTLAELAGLPPPTGPQPIDGTSLVPVLRDPTARVRDHAYHAYPRGNRMGRAIRTERYRMVEWKPIGAPADAAEFELYDYQDDPLETRNLADARPEVLAELRTILARHPEARRPDSGPARISSPVGRNVSTGTAPVQ
ncbi:MAG: sulfatase-like hydrolase/transferase, partial [Verrucomicrobiae bacterium]|nr:sulfatase-like hydrolase/transferase [Verrucomicrobiae bacterium]